MINAKRFTPQLRFLFQLLELFANLMKPVLMAKLATIKEGLCDSIIRIFEHVLYGNPPQTINQWIAAQGGWVCFTVLLYSYDDALKSSV